MDASSSTPELPEIACGAAETSVTNSSLRRAIEQQNFAFSACSRIDASPLMWSSCQCVAITIRTLSSVLCPRPCRYSIATGTFKRVRQESMMHHSLQPRWTSTHSPRPGPNIEISNSLGLGGTEAGSILWRTGMLLFSGCVGGSLQPLVQPRCARLGYV
jgi:hypothetical protein